MVGGGGVEEAVGGTEEAFEFYLLGTHSMLIRKDCLSQCLDIDWALNTEKIIVPQLADGRSSC